MIAETIEGKFVRLVTADKKDARFTKEIRQNADNTRYMPRIDVDLEQQEAWIQSQRDADDSVFFVVERLNGEPIGTFSLYNIKGETAETGRMIIRGNQMETLETVLLFHDYAFFTVGLDEVYSEIEMDNLPAQGVARSCGAKNRGFASEESRKRGLLTFTTSREDYTESRKKLEKLVDRFAGRI